VNDDKMLKKWWENLKVVFKDGAVREGLIYTNLLERHSR